MELQPLALAMEAGAGTDENERQSEWRGRAACWRERRGSCTGEEGHRRRAGDGPGAAAEDEADANSYACNDDTDDEEDACDGLAVGEEAVWNMHVELT